MFLARSASISSPDLGPGVVDDEAVTAGLIVTASVCVERDLLRRSVLNLKKFCSSQRSHVV
jgi:hypothetical protein